MANIKAVSQWNPSDYINKTSHDYSIYVCKTRGIPSIGDGLKDGQRKALYVLRNKKGEIKTISHAGDMISSGLYLHGDISAADSIGMMAAPYLNNLPLIDGIGTFGTAVSPYDIAAPRYTYVTKSITTESLVYTDLDIVPLIDNYDGTTQEPKHFLPLLPLVLLNGVKGMGVGYATNIFPRKLSGLINSVLAVLEGKNVDPTDLQPVYEFCSSGSSTQLAPNRWEFYGIVNILDTSTVTVTALPPGMNREKFIESLITMEENGKIREYVDETAENINITIKLPRGTAKDWKQSDAIEYLKLSSRDTENLVVIGWDGNIKPYDNPVDLVNDFVNKRITFYKDRYNRLIGIENKKLSLNKLLLCCMTNNIAGLMNQLRNKKEVVQFISMLAESNGLTTSDEQIDYCATLPLYRWAVEEMDLVKSAIQENEKLIADYQSIIDSDRKIKNIYRKEVEALRSKKFPTNR